MQRRTFLAQLTAAAGAAALPLRAASAVPTVQTVAGPVPAAELGFVLPHEHVLVDFVGAERITPSRYDSGEAFAAILPHLRQARALGVRTLCECTPAYLGRDPALLARLAAASGLHLVTNTGYYGARDNLFLPRHAHTETAAQLAARWIAETRDGLGSSGARPGFIKSGVDSGPALSPVHRKLVAAAALAHVATGLPAAIHLGRGPGAEILGIFAEHGASPDAFIWVHAQNAPDDALFAAADRGAWISCDGLGRNSLPRHLSLMQELKKRGHLGRVLLSHDAGWFDPGKPGGGTFRPYDVLPGVFLPLLKDNGFTPDEIAQLTVRNPAAAFALRRG